MNESNVFADSTTLFFKFSKGSVNYDEMTNIKARGPYTHKFKRWLPLNNNTEHALNLIKSN